MSCTAQAADALPSLKVEPGLLPPSQRPAKQGAAKPAATAKTAEQASDQNQQSPAAAQSAPQTAETFPVPTPGETPVAAPAAAVPAAPAAPAAVAAPQPAKAAPAAAVPVRGADESRAGRTPVADSMTARNMPPLKVDRSLVRNPPSRVAGAAVAQGGAAASVDEPLPYRNVTTARNMPPLKVDRALLGTPPVARRRTPSELPTGAAVTQMAGNAAGGEAGALPPAVPEDDESRMLRGAITLSEYVEKNPESRATLIAADQLDGTTDEVMRAVGSAELRRPGTSLTADSITYAPPTDELQADGNVRLTRGEDVIEGPSLRYRLARGEGVFEKPRYSIRRNLQTGENLRTTTGRGEAEQMEFLSDSRVRMDKATYTTCGPDNPDWYAQVDTLNLDFDSEVGEGSNGKIMFKGVPVLYSPWLDFSLNNRRKSGFLSPTFGVTNRTGVDFLLPYYWNIAPNMDATIGLRFLGTRGLMLSNEFRYLQEDYAGKLRLDYLPSDRISDRNRYAFSFQHDQQFSERLSGMLNINSVSDRDYYTDLGSRLAITSLSYLPREGSLSYAGDWWRVTGKAIEYQSLANRPEIYRQMPSVTFSALKSDLPGGLVFSTLANYTDFAIDDVRRDQGSRAFVYPQLSLPLRNPYFFVTPKVGIHLTNYQIERGTANAGQATSLSRSIPIFSLDAGTVFERDSDLFGQGYVQTFEPRMYYVLSTYKNQNRYPVFDSAQADFNFAQIFSENVFVGQDRIADSNQVTTAAISRFIDPGTGAERARLALGQRFYFSDQLVALPGGQQRTERIASTLAAVAGELLPKTWVDAAVQYNTDLSQTERYSLSARWNPRDAQVLNVAYRFRRENPLVAGEVRDLDLSAQWPLTNRWYALARHNYSIAENRLVEGLAGFEYNGGCWVGRFVFQRIATNIQRTRTALFFQLELNDFSRIGSNPLDALKRSIPGYGQINQSTADPIFGGDF